MNVSWGEKQKAGTTARRVNRLDGRVYFLGWEKVGRELEVKKNRQGDECL